MPVYEYRCKSCGTTHEIEHGYNDERPTKCPACGGELVRVFHPIGVVFKGSGFHKTDYAKSGVKPAPASDGSKSTESKAGETSSTPSPLSDSGAASSSSSDSKPAPAKKSESTSTPAPKSDK